MKVAVVYNYMDNIGGAERVALTLARELGADMFSTAVSQDAIQRLGFDVKVKSVGTVPINPPFRQQMALWRFRRLNLGKNYDRYIIAGEWAVSAAVNNKPNVWYVHSPIREFYDLYAYTRQHTVPFFAKPIFDAWVVYNRHLNMGYVKHVDKIVCNSVNTQNRIRRYLHRDARVVNPPIETSRFHYAKSDDYWLSVNRLITHKRVEMQMQAFAKMPDQKLIVVGCFEAAHHFQAYAEYIESIRPPNVTLLRSIPFDSLVELYANCKGFITTSREEDFGMTPVEAMASGKPVIAPNEGGYKESVVHGVTGQLIDDIDVEKLIAAMKEIGKAPESYRRECLAQAKKFDTTVFIKKMKDELAT